MKVLLTKFFRVVVIFVAVAVNPRFDKHKIRYERRNLALQYGGVTPNYVLIFAVRLVELIDNWKHGKNGIKVELNVGHWREILGRFSIS